MQLTSIAALRNHRVSLGNWPDREIHSPPLSHHSDDLQRNLQAPPFTQSILEGQQQSAPVGLLHLHLSDSMASFHGSSQHFILAVPGRSLWALPRLEHHALPTRQVPQARQA